MEIVGTEVDIVVKAANQQTPDVKIQALSAWSVRDLKQHLSENYPSKPKVEDQKIIYSGRLLTDSTILKDALRVYEGQTTHTLHLVCARQRQSYANGQPSSSQSPADSDGLRRRNVGEPANASTPPSEEPAPNNQYISPELQNYYAYMMSQFGRAPAPMFNAPGSQYHQMLMMQQAYAQYMQQYNNVLQNGTNGNQPQAVPAPNEQEQAFGFRRAAPAEGEEEEGLAPRDWLDWSYSLSRLGILLAVLYLYSTPLRLGLVVLLVAAYYFQQAAFREVPAQNQNQPNPEPRNPQANVPAAEAEVAQPQTEPQQSILASTWMIVTLFFTSLIPDAPTVV